MKKPNFFIVGGLNIYVAYQFSEETWVSYKLYSAIGFTLLLCVILLRLGVRARCIDEPFTLYPLIAESVETDEKRAFQSFAGLIKSLRDAILPAND